MKELLEFLVLSQDIKKLDTVHVFLLLECSEHDVLGSMCFVGDWALDVVVVMSSHGAESSSSADVLMKFVLEVNERVV